MKENHVKWKAVILEKVFVKPPSVLIIMKEQSSKRSKKKENW